MKNTTEFLTTQMIDDASDRINGYVMRDNLEFCERLSKKFNARIYLKREDRQIVRSYKIRGAYNIMCTLTEEERIKGVVCASAGNHAQGVAYSAAKLKIHATIFMPLTTPLQKINKVKHFGGKYAQMKLVGHTFDEAAAEAKSFCTKNDAIFVHPFDDPIGIAGQGTIGKELYNARGNDIDIVVGPVGGGGMIAGVSVYLKERNPEIVIYGAEPEGSPAMKESLKKGKVVELASIDTFVDGAAVKRVGDNTFKIAQKYLKDVVLVPEGKICTTMIELYQNEGIITEPAGALSIAALDKIMDQIRNKTVICILSGGNNDILRYPEIMERSLVYQGLKHYMLIRFAQKPGQLKQFVNEVLGPSDDITRFEYIKKSAKELGPALVGIEVEQRDNFEVLKKRLYKLEFDFEIISADDPLYSYLI